MATANHFLPKPNSELPKKRKRPDDDLDSPNKPSKKSKHYQISIATLPSEILLYIFSWLPHDTIVDVSRVCQRWNQLARDPFLWSNIYIDERTPLTSLYTWISVAQKLKHFSAKNRNEMDVILNKLSKRCKNLRSIKLTNCSGTPLRGALHSLPLCNLLTRCRHLHDIHFDSLTFASCKFFKLLRQNQLKVRPKKSSYNGPMTSKQFVRYLEYLVMGCNNMEVNGRRYHICDMLKPTVPSQLTADLMVAGTVFKMNYVSSFHDISPT